MHIVGISSEPNAWKRFGYNITPAEHAHDFFILKCLVEHVKPVSEMIVGPDVAGKDVDYLQRYVCFYP